MANKPYRVRIIREGMPADILDDKQALDISAVSPEACVKGYLDARITYKKDIDLAAITGCFGLEMAEPVDTVAGTVWVHKTIYCSR